jgi:hypothetical protein
LLKFIFIKALLNSVTLLKCHTDVKTSPIYIKTSPIAERVSLLKYHIEHFDILDVELLTLPRPLRADVYGDFHSFGTGLIVAFSFSEILLTYQFSG